VTGPDVSPTPSSDGHASGGLDAPILFSLAALGRALFSAAACSVALLNDAQTHLVFISASGEGADKIVGLQLAVNRGIAGWVVSSGQPIGLDDVRNDPRFDIEVATSTGYVPRSILAVPIEGIDDTIGVIQVLDPAPSTNRDDMATLAVLSGHAAHCVERASATAVRNDGSARPSAPPDLGALIAELHGLRADDRDTAVQLLATFVAHTRR
jgi:signal transduction protein with GAF and PtsI domain